MSNLLSLTVDRASAVAIAWTTADTHEKRAESLPADSPNRGFSTGVADAMGFAALYIAEHCPIHSRAWDEVTYESFTPLRSEFAKQNNSAAILQYDVGFNSAVRELKRLYK